MINYSLEELNVDISTQVYECLSEVMQELLIELQNRIEEKVYDAYEGYYAEMGYRTFDFLESFVIENLGSVLSGMTSEMTEEILHDPNLLYLYANFSFIHEQRDELAEIIESGNGYELADNIPARPFWDDWLAWCMRQIPILFNQKCKMRGLYFTYNKG